MAHTFQFGPVMHFCPEIVLCSYILFALWVYFECRATAEKHTAHILGLKTLSVGMVHILLFSVSNSFKEQQALLFKSFDAHQPVTDINTVSTKQQSTLLCCSS